MKLGTVSPPVTGSNATPASASPASSDAAAAVFPHQAPAENASPSLPSVTMAVTRQAAAQINEFLKSSAASVEFTVEGTSDHIIVRVVDSATNQVIRQIPTEEALAISHALDRMAGLLLTQKA